MWSVLTQDKVIIKLIRSSLQLFLLRLPGSPRSPRRADWLPEPLRLRAPERSRGLVPRCSRPIPAAAGLAPRARRAPGRCQLWSLAAAEMCSQRGGQLPRLGPASSGWLQPEGGASPGTGTHGLGTRLWVGCERARLHGELIPASLSRGEAAVPGVGNS